MKRTALFFGASLLCAAMAATVVAQTEPKQSDPAQTEPKAEPAQPDSKQTDQAKPDASAKDTNSLSPTGPYVIKASDSRTVKATVEDVDEATRTVTLKGEGGKTVTIKCGDEVKNFDQIKKGDQVTAKYYQSVALGIRKSDEPASTEEQRAVLRAEPGQKPGAAMIKTVQVSATVENIDKAKRELTLKGPEGKTKTVKVGEDVKNFDQLKEGDQVVATVTEALAMGVTKE
jgi:hypothetical protein